MGRPWTERPHLLEGEAAPVTRGERPEPLDELAGRRQGAGVVTNRRSGQASQRACGEKPGAAPEKRKTAVEAMSKVGSLRPRFRPG